MNEKPTDNSAPQNPRKRIIDPDPVVEAYKADVDRTLLRENLKLTPTERLIKLEKMAELADELRRAGREARERDRLARKLSA